MCKDEAAAVPLQYLFDLHAVLCHSVLVSASLCCVTFCVHRAVQGMSESVTEKLLSHTLHLKNHSQHCHLEDSSRRWNKGEIV